MTNEISPSPVDAPTDVVESIKGFDADLKCRGFQFEFGRTYTVEGKIKACEKGFHACPVDEHPLSVLDFYAPGKNRFGIVDQFGKRDRDGRKLASASITLKFELTWHEIVTRTIKWVLDRTTPSGSNHSEGDRSASSATGDRSASSATGDWSASSATGDWSASSATGDRSASSATGYQSASSATGDRSASSATGDRSASSATGDWSASSATGDQSASSATGDRSASSATGDWSASSATGDWSASSATGHRSAALATGYKASATVDSENGVAIATGEFGKARGEKAGSVLFLIERDDDGGICNHWSGKVGDNGIEPGVFYTLHNGKPVPADDAEDDED
ncbi:DUF7666 domain-containing protein [Pseudochelatococcus sp. B33]